MEGKKSSFSKLRAVGPFLTLYKLCTWTEPRWKHPKPYPCILFFILKENDNYVQKNSLCQTWEWLRTPAKRTQSTGVFNLLISVQTIQSRHMCAYTAISRRWCFPSHRLVNTLFFNKVITSLFPFCVPPTPQTLSFYWQPALLLWYQSPFLENCLIN